MADNFNILDFEPGGGAGFVFDGAYVPNSSNQSVPNNTITKLTLNAAAFDTNGYWSNSNDRMIIPANVNRIILDAKCTLGSGLSGERRFIIRKNGSSTTQWEQTFGANHSGGNNGCSISLGPIDVIEGDFFELFFQQTTGGAADVTNKFFSLFNVSDQ